jgi:hypothetical protein
MVFYSRKSDTIAVEPSFLPKIVKYRIHNMDDSSAGVALRKVVGVFCFFANVSILEVG